MAQLEARAVAHAQVDVALGYFFYDVYCRVFYLLSTARRSRHHENNDISGVKAENKTGQNNNKNNKRINTKKKEEEDEEGKRIAQYFDFQFLRQFCIRLA